MTSDELTAYVRALRIGAGLNQQQLADRLSQYLRQTGGYRRGRSQTVTRSQVANAEDPRKREPGLRALIVGALEGRLVQEVITYEIVDSDPATVKPGASADK